LKILLNNMVNRIIMAIILLLTVNIAKAQVIDEIVAVVADRIILHSEVEFEFEQLKHEFGPLHDSIKCEILNRKMVEALKIVKAMVDSVTINEDRVDAELDERVRYFARQFGGEKALEEFYGKSISEIKAGNRDKIRNAQYVQEIDRKITKDIKVSPTDIRNYFKELEMDSVPFYSAEVEVAQIIVEPKVSKDAKAVSYEKIAELRKRIVEGGEKFSTLALIYSDDKGSASKGGELGYFGRGQMVPEFEAASFKLKPDSVSKIIETKYGYHIIQMIDRKGENLNARHILIMPKTYSRDVELARNLADSIVHLLKSDSISFSQAAKKFSDDDATKANGGFVTEPNTGTTKIPVDEIDKSLYLQISSMKENEISDPDMIVLPGPEQKRAFRILLLKSETKPHRANLIDDYQKMQQLASQKKQSLAIQNWIDKNRKLFYVYVSEPYRNCKSVQPWLNKN